MKFLVCGGAGYIGAHMCKHLATHGHDVHVVDDLSTGHAAAVRWGRLHQGDLGDASFIAGVLRQVSPDGVFHFAAKSLVAESVAAPAAYYRNNVAATLTLLDALRDDPRPFIFSSTAAIFGEPRAPRIDEHHPAAPINPYGRSKLAVEWALADYWTAYRLPSACLRYFNAAGADADGEIGESHQPETHLIPRLLQSVNGGERVRLFGEDYPTPDGTCVRDYIHVDDLCTAHLQAFLRLQTLPAAEHYNLGNGEGYSVRQVFSAAAQVVGQPIEYDSAPRRPGDPPALVADATKARQQLGWRPRMPDITDIIESAWRWHRKPRY